MAKKKINIYEFQGVVIKLEDNANPTNKAPFAKLVIDIPEIYRGALSNLFGKATGKVFDIVMVESEPDGIRENQGI